MLTLNGLDEVKARVAEELGVSDWHEVTQEDIDRFAEVTGDDYWIHIDTDRAKDGPFGGTIAHGTTPSRSRRCSPTACSPSPASRSA